MPYLSYYCIYVKFDIKRPKQNLFAFILKCRVENHNSSNLSESYLIEVWFTLRHCFQTQFMQTYLHYTLDMRTASYTNTRTFKRAFKWNPKWTSAEQAAKSVDATDRNVNIFKCYQLKHANSHFYITTTRVTKHTTEFNSISNTAFRTSTHPSDYAVPQSSVDQPACGHNATYAHASSQPTVQQVEER